ncbi:MAG: N-acetylglucosamine-6-phosphate deacetylase [Verrucomicrobiales bacterium]
MNSLLPLDLQVNGYGGVDFCSTGTTPEQFSEACAALKEDGFGGVLATIITDHAPEMAAKLSQITAAREADPAVAEMIVGIHIEGPFLSPADGYRGAHPLPAVKEANLDDMQQLLDAGGGLTKLVTLAPEQDRKGEVTRFLVDQGITVSAGHCNPSMDQLKAGIDAGLSMFTHLGNACPILMHRHDNVIQRALSLSDDLWICVIVDGVHVEFPALKNYIRAAGIDRTIAVTDAISAARLGPGRYTLAGWDLVIGDDLVARAPDGSHFVGSTVTMPRLLANLRDELGLNEDEIEALTVRNPRVAIGLG